MTARGREDTGRYAKAKKARLGRFLKPGHGIPHHDVYRRVISRIAPEESGGCFMNWLRAIKREYGREAADVKSGAIDGKTVRGHFKGGGKRRVSRARGRRRTGRYSGR
ncbi:MAG: transposase family protein [Spirochaetaceae bacterium]|nr:transposase family protein [Spirochaetaceae bacterium]